MKRRFIVNEIPFLMDSYFPEKIEKSYLFIRPEQLVLSLENGYILWIRGRGMKEPFELKVPITKEMYSAYQALAVGNKIEKLYYQIPFQNTILDLQIYEGVFEGLKIVEISEDLLQIPDWFLQEITDNCDYRDVNLSMLEPYEIFYLLECSKKKFYQK